MLAAILVPCLLLGPSQSQQFQALAGEDIMLMARETLLILRAAEELSMDGRCVLGTGRACSCSLTLRTAAPEPLTGQRPAFLSTGRAVC